MKLRLVKLAAKLSLADIEKLAVLKRSGGRIAKLEKKKKVLERKLAKIEKQIAALSGGKPGKRRGRKPGRRPGRKSASKIKRHRTGLSAAVRKAMAAGKPMKVADIALALPKKFTGPRTLAKTKKKIGVILMNRKLFQRVKVGQYVLKK